MGPSAGRRREFSVHYRMHFAWLGDAVWLLRFSESISPEGTVTMTRTRKVKVNGREVAAAETDAERRSRDAARVLLDMLDHNRPWLDGGPTGSGWRPPFRDAVYTFHTVREDVRETCVLDRDGEAVFEVSHDGLGKMKDQLGNRWMALATRECIAQPDEAPVRPRPCPAERDRDQPFDLALKHYARIGCQFDLPLFRYRDQLDFATVTIEDGTWAGRPCRVATVSNLSRGPLGCGTMLAFTSWSYMHHIAPGKEVLDYRPRPERADPRDDRERAGQDDLRDRLRRLRRGRARPVGAPVDPDRGEGRVYLRVPLPARRRHALDAGRGRLLVQAGGQEPRRRRRRAGRRRPRAARRRLAAG